MSTPNKLVEKYKALSSGTRTAIIGGAAVISLFTLGTIFSDESDTVQVKSASDKETFTVANPGTANATEGVAANLEEAKRKLEAQEQKIALLEESNKQAAAQSNTDGRWNEISNLVSQVQALQEKVNSMSGTPVPQSVDHTASPNGKGALDSPLPAPGSAEARASSDAPTAAPVQPPQTIQVVGEEKKSTTKKVDKKETPSAYVPSGSNFEAVLLNGMDASTAIGANRTPTPALLRIKTEAILPNMFSFNVRECFVMVGGYGNMSSERVEMRTETMSCIEEGGAVWEGKIEGYLVGEDGKAGARGRVVSKQGALLAKSFMSGFVGGLGGAFSPQPVQSLNLNGGSTQSYQMPGVDQVVGGGISQGLSKSSQALSSFYIKLAEQMFPIVELDAGRKMTVILLKGVELKMEKKT